MEFKNANRGWNFKGLVFIDRDGVINRNVSRNDGTFGSPRTYLDFQMIRGADKGIKLLKKEQLCVVVVTNQPDIDNHKISITEINKINNFLINKLEIDLLYICPHKDKRECLCRKPKTLMLEIAFNQIQLLNNFIFMVGDRDVDILAGDKFGAKTIHIGCRRYRCSTKANHHKKNLLSASYEIVRQLDVLR